MKTLTIIPTILASVMLFSTTLAKANDSKYAEVMQKNIQAVYTTNDVVEIQNIVNTFERIGDSEKTKWEPYYYAAYGYIMMANREQEPAKKDSYLDLALQGIEKAKAIQPSESEVVALEGFVHMIRVSIDPASRGQQYSGMAMQAFGKAVALNPENPRALSLLAQMQFGMAQFFGSPVTEACVTNTKAIEKFNTGTSENPLAPRWGKGIAEALKAKCN
jgi:hypothetical protein